MARSRSVSTRNSSAATILKFVKAYAAGKGFRFGPGAEDYMRQHATNAGRQIDALPKSKQAAKLKKAEDNFATLIDEMIKEASTIPGYEDANPGSIGERTLSNALSTLCPLWPFC